MMDIQPADNKKNYGLQSCGGGAPFNFNGGPVLCRVNDDDLLIGIVLSQGVLVVQKLVNNKVEVEHIESLRDLEIPIHAISASLADFSQGKSSSCHPSNNPHPTKFGVLLAALFPKILCTQLHSFQPLHRNADSSSNQHQDHRSYLPLQTHRRRLNLLTGETVTMKVVSKDKIIKAEMIDQVKCEISIMKKVHHPNVVKLHEVMATKSKIYFAMEYLHRAANSSRNRGVKPENLLLDESGNLKVTVFGFSVFLENLKHDGLLHIACGTSAYVAPKVIEKRGYNVAKADLRSCGVILFILLSGYLPFQSNNTISLYKKIYRTDFKFPPWFSSKTHMIANRLLDPNPIT
ncbi:hypothetical protein ACSBR2_014119 [Camellia fascicularis]